MGDPHETYKYTVWPECGVYCSRWYMWWGLRRLRGGIIVSAVLRITT